MNMSLLWPSGTLEMPTVAPGNDSEFGERIHPIDGDWRMHWGIDLIGFSHIHACIGGIVKFAGENGGHGNHVVVISGGLELRFSHLEEIWVVRGEAVRPDTIVGVMGNTGASFGVHLHFEALIDGKHVDPRTLYGIKPVPRRKETMKLNFVTDNVDGNGNAGWILHNETENTFSAPLLVGTEGAQDIANSWARAGGNALHCKRQDLKNYAALINQTRIAAGLKPRYSFEP